MDKYKKLIDCISTCHFVFQRYCEADVVYTPPEKAEEIREGLRTKMKALEGALQFANGENVMFDTNEVKRIVGEYIDNSFKGEEVIELRRELWNLCQRRIMLPPPKMHTVDEMKAVNEKLDAIIHDLARLESKAQQKPESKNAPEPTPEEKSTVAFIRTKVSLLPEKEYEQFMNTKPGKRLPEFVKQWKEEMQQMQYFVSDKTFYNALYIVRKCPSR